MNRRSRGAEGLDTTDLQLASKKRVVTYSTFQKWQEDFDKEWNTISWLDCEARLINGKKVVEKMKCKVCTKFQPSIEGRKNYSSKWIIGADSIRASNVKDHAKNDQHTHAMMLLTKEKARAAGQGPSAYAPIIQAFN